MGRSRAPFNDYRVANGVAYLALTNRKGEVVAEAMVDVADLPRLIAHGRRWHASQVNPTNVYVMYRRPKAQYLHRFLLPDARMVDHINGNGLDNQRHNLRPCNHSQNAGNMPKHRRNTTGYKGVNRSRDKWVAQIKVAGRKHYLGTFRCPIEAARAYDRAARELRGEFARLNFPDQPQPMRLARPA